jgi:beta-glucuronidase
MKLEKLLPRFVLNRYYGWYVLGGYEIDTAEKALRSELEGWKAKNLNKPFVFTEYGADTDSGIHKLPSVQWSQEYQIEVLEMNHRVFDSCDFVKGDRSGLSRISRLARAFTALTVIRKASLQGNASPKRLRFISNSGGKTCRWIIRGENNGIRFYGS